MHEILRETRLEKGYSQRYMAEKLNISKPFFCQLENDKRKLNYDMALKIACILDVKPDDLFYEEHLKRINEEY